MRQLISMASMAVAIAWSGVALAVVDQNKEVPVTGTEVPTDRSTGKTISTSKVTDGKTHISIHDPQLNRNHKVIVTLTNDKGEPLRDAKGEKIERRDVTLGWIFENGIAFNAPAGGGSEGGNRQVVHRTHRISEQARSSSVVAPAPVLTQPFRGWQIGLGGTSARLSPATDTTTFPPSTVPAG